jgi:hypothetical protein
MAALSGSFSRPARCRTSTLVNRGVSWPNRQVEPAKSGLCIAAGRLYARSVALVDVVVVSYNSREHLRPCVEPLARDAGVRVLVVDNASPDRAHESVADLPVTVIALRRNGGFAHGCNAGWRAGDAPYVLLLNPDSRVLPAAVARLAQVLDASPDVGAVAPKLVDGTGALLYSQRRYPRLLSTYARALFLHRLFPRADELVRDEAAYERPGPADWVSGACILFRREALERAGGLDEGFFMYCEETDLCRRLRADGYDTRFEPGALCVHFGYASAPRASLLPVLAASRIRYARKHRGRLGVALERLGIALESATHVLVSRGGTRLAHLRSLGVVARG